ncbi:MAG: GrpB family protein [Clostridia bacterium]|nr:GrpB family protein [Clostridia bacterium]
MKMAKVVVLPYDESWKADFENIKAELDAVLGDLALAIEHVGSTSVEGLSAKPVIDIDVVIRDYSVFPAAVDRLASIGYFHQGDLGIKEREAFGYRDKPHLQKHHLYVCPAHSAELKRHTTFRDFLRTHPDSVKEYGEIKQKAAQLFPDDIDKYIEYKSPCIEKIYEKCGLK